VDLDQFGSHTLDVSGMKLQLKSAVIVIGELQIIGAVIMMMFLFDVQETAQGTILMNVYQVAHVFQIQPSAMEFKTVQMVLMSWFVT
jgi:hypothetical protein